MTMFESSRILRGASCVMVTGLLATSSVAQFGATLSRASPARIAFASNRDGNWEIYVTDVDGQNQTRLTKSDPQDRFPLWSPDRSQIAFASEINGDHWELWVMNADGTKPRRLATQIVAKGHRQWSHDGNRIVFAATVDGNVEIFSVDVASGRLNRLTTSPGVDRDPAWSPDDRHIVFSSTRDGNSEIYVMRTDGTLPRRLTNEPALDGSPAWSPDGSKIAFVSARDAGGGTDRDVYLVRFDDGRVERLTTGARAMNDGPRWSANGTYIAFQSTERGNYDIQLVRMADHERRMFVGTPSYDGQYNWSPAGDQLVFISSRDGFNAVYVTDVTGQPNRLTTTESLDPGW
jgi:Tol biopolymer transport system component